MLSNVLQVACFGATIAAGFAVCLPLGLLAVAAACGVSGYLAERKGH